MSMCGIGLREGSKADAICESPREKRRDILEKLRTGYGGKAGARHE